MHRGREARLERLTRRGGEGDRDAAERHRLLAARAAIGAAVRWSLARHGIDPADAAALRVADEAAAELGTGGPERWTDTPTVPSPVIPGSSPRRGRLGRGRDDRDVTAEQPAGDRDRSAGPLSLFDDRIDRLVERYRGRVRTAPDLARSSLAELLAWCIAGGDGSGPACARFC
jgi:hypothetical protein